MKLIFLLVFPAYFGIMMRGVGNDLHYYKYRPDPKTHINIYYPISKRTYDRLMHDTTKPKIPALHADSLVNHWQDVIYTGNGPDRFAGLSRHQSDSLATLYLEAIDRLETEMRLCRQIDSLNKLLVPNHRRLQYLKSILKI